ncbi:glycosyltransferase [Photobacterium phosphoreum]|nr:glycosyltransferase [Photobacterium phosphoreum]
MLTVFTPTYNRAKHLHLCYQSLVSQEFKDFEWLIIDDGSTDNTKEVVEKFQLDNRIKIRYIYQENAGKQAAWNKAVLEASGTYFIGVDSDDKLIDNSLILFFEKYIPKIDNQDNILGIRALSKKNSTKQADSKFSIDKDNYIASWFEEFSFPQSGERIDIFKTNILKKFLYPITSDIKFIPEIWFYSSTANKYKFLYVNKYLGLFFDEGVNNRLSRSNLLANAKGHQIARGTMLKCIPLRFLLKNPMAFLKAIIRYCHVSFYLLMKKI